MKFFEKVLLLFKAVANIKNWPTCLLEYIGLIKNDQFNYIFKNGITCVTRTNSKDDRAVIKGVWLNQVYLLKEDDIQEGATIIDLGAQIGSFSLFAASRARNVKVYAYEPCPENFAILQTNVGINKLEDKIKVFDCAISNCDTKIKLFIDPKSTVGHTTIENLASLRGTKDGNFEGKAIDGGEEACSIGKSQRLEVSEEGEATLVNAITLEQIFEKNGIKTCSLLKMDIEGAEYPVLYNMPDELFEKIEKIYLDCDDVDGMDKYNHQCLKIFLEEKGYIVSYKSPFLYARKTPLEG